MNLHHRIHVPRPIRFLLALGFTATCLWPLVDPIVLGLHPGVTVPLRGVVSRSMTGQEAALLLIGVVVGVAATLWQAWARLIERPAFAKRASAVPRGWKLAGAAGFTAAAFLPPVALGTEMLVHQSPTARPSVARALEHQVRPAWPAIVDLVTRGLPPAATPMPTGDVRPTLRAMLGRPYVDTAFYLGPDAQLHILTRSRDGGGPREVRQDLATWRPTILARNKQGRMVKQLRQYANSAAANDDLINTVVDRLMFIQGFRRAEFRAVPADDVWRPTMFTKGDERTGYLGYLVDKGHLAHDADAVFARLGLQDSVAITFSDREEPGTTLFEPPVALPSSLATMRLTPSWLEVDRFAERHATGQFLAAIVAMGAGGFGLMLGFGQLRAFLDDRAVALAQSNFISAVSHEMRTPLTTIKLYAEMVEQDVITDPERRNTYMRVIAKECDRLGRLVENVLDYAAVSGRRKDYHFQPTSVRAVVDEAVATLQGPLDRAGMTVEVDVPDHLTASADPDALMQVVINLLGNAVKYAAAGQRVQVVGRAEGGTAVTLTVKDFGPGIAPGEQKKIFRPFYRVGSELTRTAVGTGLGLALVKAHAEAHGGRVELESAPGAGATFRLVLPVERKTA